MPPRAKGSKKKKADTHQPAQAVEPAEVEACPAPISDPAKRKGRPSKKRAMDTPVEEQGAMVQESESDSDVGSDYEESSESEEDFDEVDPRALTARLTAERAMWAEECTSSTPGEGPGQSSSGKGKTKEVVADKEVEYPQAEHDHLGVATVDRVESTSTIVSSTCIDESEPQASLVLQSAGKKRKAKKKAPSKRDMQAAREQPIWQTTSTGTSSRNSSAALASATPQAPANAAPPTPMTTGSNLYQTVTQTPPHPDPQASADKEVAPITGPPAGPYVLVPPTNPGSGLTLTPQHPHIRAMLQATFPRIEAELAFTNSFPNILERKNMVVKCMIAASEHLGYESLKDRASVSVISTFRGALKKSTDAHVVLGYGLSFGDCQQRVEWLLPHLTYIYPATFKTRETTRPPWNKPYEHPAVLAVLRAFFFSRSNAFASVHAERFTSSLETRPHEKEIPATMLAFVGAAMHASLSEWQTGTRIAVSFAGDTFADADIALPAVTATANMNSIGLVDYDGMEVDD
ncbi:hypothetical protein ACG7TL_007344 [Trametes sanguinea]